MHVRYVDKRSGVVEVRDGKRDLSYSFVGGSLHVHYTIERKKRNGRKVRMHRELDPNSKKAAEIRAILDATE